ncbi:methyltransferase domain-containing protein [Rubrivivax gelatinosus]|uniref:methyltransferase domain-containing protein n=1 Tax=Rubrivivax gelatinosus TaxID=28068 RepID=UPI0002F6ADE9|nr:methyltransferase domain-containing protein [Rubrivivax gelatinosus]
MQERERALLRRLAAVGLRSLAPLAITEVGCGGGGNLLGLLRLGASPEHLTGLELLPERHAQARHVLPPATAVWLGDACVAPVPPASQDLVLQADAMWRWLKPGGAVLWYDFTVDNPKNRDVRGVPLKRVRALFPEGRVHAERLTLAPPLARAACALHPALYRPLAAVPGLSTHVLAWIAKPA